MEDTLRVYENYNEWINSTIILILVLMEDTLRVNNMNKESKIKAVLILVVMEDTLRVVSGQEYHNPWSS